MVSQVRKRRVYPFTAIVGQAEMKLALLLNVIDPRIGGVMIMGDRGTGKSTTIRALADLRAHRAAAVVRAVADVFGLRQRSLGQVAVQAVGWVGVARADGDGAPGRHDGGPRQQPVVDPVAQRRDAADSAAQVALSS